MGALPPEARIAFSQGERISDRYVIDRPLGRGGMGTVYLAYDALMHEQVALKFLHPGLLRTQRGQFLFVQEAQIARRLRHDHIVALHDAACTAEGVLYLSMEYLPGRPLRQALRERRMARSHMDVRLAVRITAQILDALSYAHRTVIHRDIKPENLMILPGEHVKVLDFGLAKALDAETLSAGDAPREPRVVGTFAYAAPEQKRHGDVDPRADLYAVGLVLRELLTLRTPLDPPADVAEVRRDVAPSILAVLDKALKEDRENRWQDAREFRQRLLDAFDESYRRPAAPPVSASKPDLPSSTHGMVFLEGGHFLMGNNGVRDEAPEFEAYVAPFYMDVTPVTVGQYEAFLRTTGHPIPRYWENEAFRGPDQPIVGVSWADANAYAAWTGKRLPTEAEWEYAARGKENRRYPWGNAEPDFTRANYGDYLSMPSIVGMHEDGASPDGIHDLAGNVHEWTANPFAPYEPSENGPARSSSSPRRAVRGGCWHSGPDELRCAHRKGLFPETKEATLGFRCVLSAEP